MSFTFEELLKFRLLADGIRVAPDAAAAWAERFGGPMTLAEYATTSGVSLLLPGDLYVNAPLGEADDLPVLRADGGGFALSMTRAHVAVDVVPVPAFHATTQPDLLDPDHHEQPLTNYGVTHTDRCRVSPIGGCAWKCKFCDLPYEFGYRKKHEDNLLAVILAAKDDPLAPARHALVSGGTPRAPMLARGERPAADDEAWIDRVYAYLAEHAPMPVDIMLAPRRNLDHPDRLRAAGVNALSVNLEISDPERARQLAPVKAKLGRDHALAYIERAVDAFGVGFVQSLLVFGSAIEPMESTLKGVQDLVDRGCVPVLSAFRPHDATPLRDAPAATFEEMLEAYERTLEICAHADNGVRPGPRCIACQHNTVTIPDGSYFYAGLEDDLTDRACVVC